MLLVFLSHFVEAFYYPYPSLRPQYLRVVLRIATPSFVWISGVTLAFARAVGEYGSVVFIAGNMPMRTEIAPLLIVIKLEQYDYAGAAAVGLAMVVISFGSLIAINVAQLFLARRGKA